MWREVWIEVFGFVLCMSSQLFQQHLPKTIFFPHLNAFIILV